jgi:hypothetical protein
MSGRRAIGTLALALAATALIPSAAAADKLSAPLDAAGPSGVTSADGGSQYMTRPAGRRTVVRRVDPSSGRVLSATRIAGRFAIPAVSLDGTPSGLSHDGRTLVLIRPRTGPATGRTKLAILDARQLRLRRVFTLHGDFSFDALSPDGRTAYLVQHPAHLDPTHYLVRALDPTTGRLRAQPIVDPNEDPDEMRGLPLTRATGPGGRWQYTLYDGAGGHPFVHALDTQAGRAKCIDLPPYRDPSLLLLKLPPGGGGGLDVEGPQGTYAHVDTTTFAVSKPGAESGAVTPPAGGESGSLAWVPAAVVIALGLSFVALARRRRRLAGRPESAAELVQPRR